MALTDINNPSGSTASGTAHAGLTSANYGITSPYVMNMLGRGSAIANQPYIGFRLPGGEGQADSARVANMNPMETNAYNAMGGMNFQDPMNYGMGAVRGATESQWGAGTASPYMNAYNASVGGGNPLYNQATSGIAGLDFQRGMARGMGGTEAAMNSSFNTSGQDYINNYRNAIGSSDMLNKANQAIGGMNAANGMRQGQDLISSAATSQFGGREANQYLNPMRQQVGTSANLNAASNDFGRAGGGQGMQEGMQRLSDLGGSSFGEKEAQQYMSPYMKNVMEQQKQGAIQDYARQLPGQTSAAFQAGAGRGTRSALLQAEGQRNLQNQLQDITAKGTQSAYENAQKQYGEDAARRMQAAQSQVSSGTDITGRRAQLGENELTRRQQQYNDAMNQYNADINRRMTGGQNLFNVGSDIYGKQYQSGTDELNRNRDAYTAAQNQYNTEQQNRLTASGQLFNQAGDIYNRQYTAGDTQQQRQIDAYNRSMDQYNNDMNRRMTGGQNMWNMGTDVYGRQISGGEAMRGQKQRELDAMYEDFKEERDTPKSNVNYMMQLLGQVPQYQDYSTKSYQTAAPVDPNAAKFAAAGLGLDALQQGGGLSGIWEQLKGLFGGG
jgi:hypothetical protein